MREHHDIVLQAEAEQAWLEQRVDDPELSDIGKQEAKDFAAYFVPLFQDSGTEVKVYVSPFHRTLQTAQPLCEVTYYYQRTLCCSNAWFTCLGHGCECDRTTKYLRSRRCLHN